VSASTHAGYRRRLIIMTNLQYLNFDRAFERLRLLVVVFPLPIMPIDHIEGAIYRNTRYP